MKKNPGSLPPLSDPPPHPSSSTIRLYLDGSVCFRSRSKYSVAERFNPSLDLSCVRFQSVTLAPTMPKVATATPNRTGPMLCPGMGRSPPADAPVSAALDGLAVLEKARAEEEEAEEEGLVRIDAIAAAPLRLLLCADAEARENRAAVQRTTLGAILVSEEDILWRIKSWKLDLRGRKQGSFDFVWFGREDLWRPIKSDLAPQ